MSVDDLKIQSGRYTIRLQSQPLDERAKSFSLTIDCFVVSRTSSNGSGKENVPKINLQTTPSPLWLEIFKVSFTSCCYFQAYFTGLVTVSKDVVEFASLNHSKKSNSSISSVSRGIFISFFFLARYIS